MAASRVGACVRARSFLHPALCSWTVGKGRPLDLLAWATAALDCDAASCCDFSHAHGSASGGGMSGWCVRMASDDLRRSYRGLVHGALELASVPARATNCDHLRPYLWWSWVLVPRVATDLSTALTQP